MILKRLYHPILNRLYNPKRGLCILFFPDVHDGVDLLCPPAKVGCGAFCGAFCGARGGFAVLRKGLWCVRLSGWRFQIVCALSITGPSYGGF